MHVQTPLTYTDTFITLLVNEVNSYLDIFNQKASYLCDVTQFLTCMLCFYEFMVLAGLAIIIKIS